MTYSWPIRRSSPTFDEPEPGQPFEDHHRRVLDDRADEDQALALAVLGREADPVADRRRRTVDCGLLAVDPDPPRRPRQLTEDHLGQLGAPRPDQPREADDLAGPDLEVDPLVPVAVDALGAEHHAVLDRRPALEHVGQLAADHQPDDLLLAQVTGLAHCDQLPVAHHRDALGEAQDLVDAVAHVDDRDTLVAQPANEREQALHLLVGERRGRLVEGEEPDAGLERPHDLDHLALSRREHVAHQVRRQHALEAVAPQVGGNELVHPLAVHERSARRELAGVDVLSDVDAGDDLGLLVDDPDPGADGVARAPERQLLAVARHGALRPAGSPRTGSSGGSTCRRRSRPSGRGSRRGRTSIETSWSAWTFGNDLVIPRISRVPDGPPDPGGGAEASGGAAIVICEVPQINPRSSEQYRARAARVRPGHGLEALGQPPQFAIEVASMTSL